MKIYKKIFALIFAFLITVMQITTSFCVGVNDASQYVTKEEFKNRISNIKTSINQIQNNLSNDLNTKIRDYFTPVVNEPVVGDVGIGIDEDSLNNKWRIFSTGAEYTLLDGIYTRKQLIEFMKDSDQQTKYFCTKLATSDSPFRDPQASVATYTCLMEVLRDGSNYKFTAYNPETGRKYVSMTNDAGTSYKNWSILGSKVPWVVCTYDPTSYIQYVKMKWDQINPSGFVADSLDRGQMFLIKFTRGYANTNALRLRINGINNNYTVGESGVSIYSTSTSYYYFPANTILLLRYCSGSDQIEAIMRSTRTNMYSNVSSGSGTTSSWAYSKANRKGCLVSLEYYYNYGYQLYRYYNQYIPEFMRQKYSSNLYIESSHIEWGTGFNVAMHQSLGLQNSDIYIRYYNSSTVMGGQWVYSVY